MSIAVPANSLRPNPTKPRPRVGGLGRGLATLIGGTPLASQASTMREYKPYAADKGTQPLAAGDAQPMQIALRQVVPSSANPRSEFDHSELAALAASIGKQGVIQPILVRRAGNDKYQIVAGERRWRAAKLAGLSEIPAWIRELDDATALEVALIENVQRTDLNPMDEANGYHQLIEQYGYSQRVIGEVVGRSKSHVANTLRLLQLPAAVKKLVQSGKISAGHARAALACDQPEALANQVVQGDLSVRQAETLAKQWNDAKSAGSDGKVIEVQSHRRSYGIAPEEKNAEAQMVAEVAAALGVSISISYRGEQRVLKLEAGDHKALTKLCQKMLPAPKGGG